MPKYKNSDKKIRFFNKITLFPAEIPFLMGLCGPHQIDLGHLMEMVLQLMDHQWLRNMPPVLPIPHLKMGKTPLSGQQDTERPPHVLDLPIRKLLFLKPELSQLILIQRYAI
jgi:hypothetical protein